MPDKKSDFKVRVEVRDEPQATVQNPQPGVQLPQSPTQQPAVEPKLQSKEQPINSTQNIANQPQIKPINLNSSTPGQDSGGGNSLSITAIFISFLLSLAVGGLIIFGIFYYKSNYAGSKGNVPTQKTPVPIPTNELSESPAPTPEAVELKDIKVQVLNGSGKVGEASYAADLLEDSGFEDIDTANAKTYDHEKTEVSTYKGMSQQVVDAITDALGEYDTVVREDLDENYQYDMVIILGNR